MKGSPVTVVTVRAEQIEAGDVIEVEGVGWREVWKVLRQTGKPDRIVIGCDGCPLAINPVWSTLVNVQQPEGAE